MDRAELISRYRGFYEGLPPVSVGDEELGKKIPELALEIISDPDRTFGVSLCGHLNPNLWANQLCGELLKQDATKEIFPIPAYSALIRTESLESALTQSFLAVVHDADEERVRAIVRELIREKTHLFVVLFTAFSREAGTVVYGREKLEFSSDAVLTLMTGLRHRGLRRTAFLAPDRIILDHWARCNLLFDHS